MFYDNYCVLCEMKKVTPTKAAKAVGLSAAAPTKWKKTGASPSAETLQKLAAYFGITVDELLGKEKQPTEGELHPANKNLWSFPGLFRRRKPRKYIRPFRCY